MSLFAYPTYKASGISWLGQVPSGWSIQRSDTFLSSSREQIEASTLDGKTVFHYSIPVVQESGTGQLEDGSEIDSSKLVVRVRQLLVSKLNPRKGTICIAVPHDELTVCSTEFVPLLSESIDLNFIRYLVLSENYRQRLESLVESSTRSHQRVNPSDILKFMWALPSPIEQTLIAAFLDRETAKIDALVAEQEKLIELLKEKRQALISHAVTKGLNPHAPMKPSGIEWLGDVPAHWEIMKGSRLGVLFGSEQVPEEEVCLEGEVPFIKVGSLGAGSFELDSCEWFLSVTNQSRYTLRSDYLVFPKRGAAIFLNKVNIVRCPSVIDPNLMGWKLHPEVCPEYIAYTLQTRKLQELADVSTVPQINNKHVNPEPFPLPPKVEQERIVRFLGEKLKELGELNAESERAITLLQERRTALISAAVTGQIDVRNAA